MFPSPCGVNRVSDTDPGEEVVETNTEVFPSPCGVNRVSDPMPLETLHYIVFKVRLRERKEKDHFFLIINKTQTIKILKIALYQ